MQKFEEEKMQQQRTHEFCLLKAETRRFSHFALCLILKREMKLKIELRRFSGIFRS